MLHKFFVVMKRCCFQILISYRAIILLVFVTHTHTHVRLSRGYSTPRFLDDPQVSSLSSRPLEHSIFYDYTYWRFSAEKTDWIPRVIYVGEALIARGATSRLAGFNCEATCTSYQPCIDDYNHDQGFIIVVTNDYMNSWYNVNYHGATMNCIDAELGTQYT